MRAFQILLTSFILGLSLSSCHRERIVEEPYLSGPIEPAGLGFELEEPQTILPDFTNGQLAESMTGVLRSNSNATQLKWDIFIDPVTQKLSQIKFYKPHYQVCEENVFDYYYNDNGSIDHIISTRDNSCLEFVSIRRYDYTYNHDGLLKSMIMTNESFLEENYFEYYPNGRIKNIYSDFRSAGFEVEFLKRTFYYDDDYNNVVKEVAFREGDVHYTYDYSYDDQINPFKGLFIANSVQMPFIGAGFLSENNVISVTSKNERNIHNQSPTTDYLYLYNNNQQLYDYRKRDQTSIYTVYP